MRRLLTAALLTIAAPASAASFDCHKAAAPDERAICADRALNDQDVRMATLIGMLNQLQAMGGQGVLRDEQRAWLAQRRLCGANYRCLAAAYGKRVNDLQASFSAFAQRVN